MIRKFLFIKSHRRKIIEKASFVISTTFGIFNCILWITSKSLWYLILAIYYVSLSLARGGIYFQKRKRKKKEKENGKENLTLYRRSAIFLLIMNFAVGISILLTVFFEISFKYSGAFIYGVSIYTSLKIFFAIMNISKAHGTSNYLELAYRSLNLVDGTFSLFALQSAITNRFTEGCGIVAANLISGAVTVLFNLSLGIFMLVKAKKEMSNIALH